uniref:Uncharacterized protein n=1 Tax=Romanomermis culicivorax TaxID=13658 RepID=A0A915KQ28_ROMCU
MIMSELHIVYFSDDIGAENVFNGLFGYNLIQSSTKEIVVVGRESDAMVIYQATKHFVPTVVLPDAGGPLSYD